MLAVVAQAAHKAAEASNGDDYVWVVALVLGAALTAPEAVATKSFEASKSKQAWLRDQQLRCSSALLAEAHVAGKALWELADAVSQASSAGVGGVATPTEAAASRDANAAVALVNSRVAEVQLLLSERTRTAANDLSKRLDDASEAFHNRSWMGGRNPNEVIAAFNEHSASIAMNTAIDAFTAAARSEVID